MRRSPRDFASDAELQTITDLWGAESIEDIATQINRPVAIVEKWARHVLNLWPKNERYRPTPRKKLNMRCQRCQRLQTLAETCVQCGSPRWEKRSAA